MIGIFMFTLMTACSETDAEEPVDEKPKKEEISCMDACKMIQADPRKGPPFIQFHWKTQGNPEYQRCFEAAIEQSMIPEELKCKDKALAKCETSCKKMTEREHK